MLVLIPYGAETSTEVEATAYAVLALVGAGDTSGAYPGARWLLMRRNARGGFQSTQDTVVALEALGAYAAATFSDVASPFGDTRDSWKVFAWDYHHRRVILRSHAALRRATALTRVCSPLLRAERRRVDAAGSHLQPQD